MWIKKCEMQSYLATNDTNHLPSFESFGIWPTSWASLPPLSALWNEGKDKLPPFSHLCFSSYSSFTWLGDRPHTQTPFSCLIGHAARSIGGILSPRLSSQPGQHNGGETNAQTWRADLCWLCGFSELELTETVDKNKRLCHWVHMFNHKCSVGTAIEVDFHTH